MARDLGAGPVGVGVAAQIHRVSGLVLVAPNLGWHAVPFADILAEALGRPVWLLNDVDAATYGEWRVGAARPFQDCLCIVLGTGLGMGAVVAGQLLSGAHGAAAELGHVCEEPGGRLCGCGRHGCLEAYVGGASIAARSDGLLANANALQAAMPHPLADDMAERLARHVGNCLQLFDPAAVLLGGGVLAAAPSLLDLVRTAVLRYVVSARRPAVAVIAAALGDRAGAIGAARWAEERAHDA
jgi:glucokinase